MVYIVLAVACWYAIGVFSFIYWWTTEYDLDIGLAVFSLLIGLIGPMAFICGWIIHSPRETTTLWRKRATKD